MSKFFDPSEYLCWMTGGERKKKYPYVPPVRTEKSQFAKKVRNPQVGKRGVKHPAILKTMDSSGFQPGEDNSWQAYIQEPPTPKRVRKVRRIKWDLKHDRRQMDNALRTYKGLGGPRVYSTYEDNLIRSTRPLKALCTLLNRSPDSIWSRHSLLKKRGLA